MPKVQQRLGEGSGWMIESMEGDYINSYFYDLLAGSSHMQLPEESKHLRKALINIKNEDNEFFLVSNMTLKFH